MGAQSSKTQFISLDAALKRFTYKEILKMSNSYNIIKVQNNLNLPIRSNSNNSNFTAQMTVSMSNSMTNSFLNRTSSNNSSGSSKSAQNTQSTGQGTTGIGYNPSNVLPDSEQYKAEIAQILSFQENFYISHQTFQAEILGTIFPTYISNKIYSLFATSTITNTHSNTIIDTHTSENKSSSASSSSPYLLPTANSQHFTLNPNQGLYSKNKLSFNDLICCLAIIFKGKASELTMLAYYICLDEAKITDFSTMQPLLVSKDSFERTLLLSEDNFNQLQLSTRADEKESKNKPTLPQLINSFGTGQYLPASAKSLYQNTSDIIPFNEFANFITFYPGCARIFSFLSAGVGFADSSGNCPVGSNSGRYLKLDSEDPDETNLIDPTMYPDLTFNKSSAFIRLSQLTTLNISEISTIYDNFQKMKIKNIFNFQTFKNYFSQFESEKFKEKLFDYLDLNGSGMINFKEICYCLDNICRGSMAERLGFLFRFLKEKDKDKNASRDDTSDLTDPEISSIWEFRNLPIPEQSSQDHQNIPKNFQNFINQENFHSISLLFLISDYLQVIFMLKPQNPKEEGCIISRNLSQKFLYFYEKGEYVLVEKNWFKDPPFLD